MESCICTFSDPCGSRVCVTESSELPLPVETGETLGFLNQHGEFVIDPQFEAASSFSEGLAAVEIDDEWGFINKDSDIVINPHR